MQGEHQQQHHAHVPRGPSTDGGWLQQAGSKGAGWLLQMHLVSM